jgi:2-polyprenyl-3-methyl-5-hydroxy-6-metoxy-1,4-benzoquinol methylase
MTGVNDQTPGQRLAALIKAALHKKSLRSEAAARSAMEKGLQRISGRTLRAYASGKHKRIDVTTVEFFARLFDELPNLWLEEVFRESSPSPPLLDERQIINEQTAFDQGDVVSIISSRPFLEDEDPAVADMVMENLREGVIYNYYYPASDSSAPLGDGAFDSFDRFRRHTFGSHPRERLRLFGFAVDSKRFPYFSPLHAIVVYHTKHQNRVYCLIEIAVSRANTLLRWYPLPEKSWDQVHAALKRAVDPVASFGERDYFELDAASNSLRQDYVNWFREENNVKRYSRLAEVVAHRDGRCSDTLKEMVTSTPTIPRSSKDTVRYLDIGCGSGSITAEIAKVLVRSGASAVVHGLDTSAAQIELARSATVMSRVTFDGVCQRFEDLKTNEPYDVITAVHSLYVVDLAYFRKIFELLRPGGVACIWIGTLKGNAVNSLSNAFDREMRGGQRRTYAEDICEIIDLSGMRRHATVDVKESKSRMKPLVHGNGQLTEVGEIVGAFCALTYCDLTADDRRFAADVLRSDELRDKDGTALISDVAIKIARAK